MQEELNTNLYFVENPLAILNSHLNIVFISILFCYLRNVPNEIQRCTFWTILLSNKIETFNRLAIVWCADAAASAGAFGRLPPLLVVLASLEYQFDFFEICWNPEDSRSISGVPYILNGFSLKIIPKCNFDETEHEKINKVHFSVFAFVVSPSFLLLHRIECDNVPQNNNKNKIQEAKKRQMRIYTKNILRKHLWR